jgi:hypothetical protein
VPDNSQLNGCYHRAMQATAVKKLDFGQKNVYRLITVPELPSNDYQVDIIIMSGGKTQELRSIARTPFDHSLAVHYPEIGC